MKKNKNQRFTFTIYGKDYEPFRRAAISQDRSMASFARQAINKAIQEVKEQKILKRGDIN